MKKWYISLLCVAAVFCWNSSDAMALKLDKAGTYASGVFDASAAEIVGYDAQSKKGLCGQCACGQGRCYRPGGHYRPQTGGFRVAGEVRQGPSTAWL